VKEFLRDGECMDVFRQILDDERFERRLMNNQSLNPDEKREKMRSLDAKALKGSSAEIEDGQRFDVLEYPSDVPVEADRGRAMPSVRMFGSGRVV